MRKDEGVACSPRVRGEYDRGKDEGVSNRVQVHRREDPRTGG